MKNAAFRLTIVTRSFVYPSTIGTFPSTFIFIVIIIIYIFFLLNWNNYITSSLIILYHSIYNLLDPILQWKRANLILIRTFL
jgi:uncharacterized membrane protein YgaE (UPF0421/DUF939 family)